MRFVTPDFKGKNPGHYSAAVQVGNLLFISGQLSIDPDTREVCQGSIEDHAALALSNLERVLKAAGCSKEDVAFCRIYTPSNTYWTAINGVYAKFFGEHKPGRVIVSTSPLHFNCLVEIEAIVELKKE